MEIINSLGLLLDIIGAYLLLKFGLPSRVDRGGKGVLLLAQDDEDEKRELAIYRKRSNLGWQLVILGFILQLLANWL